MSFSVVSYWAGDTENILPMGLLIPVTHAYIPPKVVLDELSPKEDNVYKIGLSHTNTFCNIITSVTRCHGLIAFGKNVPTEETTVAKIVGHSKNGRSVYVTFHAIPKQDLVQFLQEIANTTHNWDLNTPWDESQFRELAKIDSPLPGVFQVERYFDWGDGGYRQVKVCRWGCSRTI